MGPRQTGREEGPGEGREEGSSRPAPSWRRPPGHAGDVPRSRSRRREPPRGRRRRPFYQDRLAPHWYAGEAIRPDESVSDAIARFDPASMPEAQWARIGPLVRTSVEKAAPATVYSARTLLSVTTQLALWADTLGQPIEAEVLFHPDLIDRFVTEGCAHLRPGTRLNYRRQLRDVGAAVLGPNLYPPRPLAIVRDNPLRPYSEEDLTALLAWCRGLPTDRFRDNAMGVIVAGLGAGLTSQGCASWSATTVADTEGVVVTVIGAKARTVPVVERWAATMHARALEVGSRPFLFPERTRISRHQLPNFLERCPTGDAPQLDTRRLRNTWIVGHLSVGTHLQSLVTAAGVAPEQVVKFLPFADHPDPAEARRQLRRASP